MTKPKLHLATLHCTSFKFVRSSKGLLFSFYQILVPLLSNLRNHEQWPAVVSQDVLRHVHQLKSNVFVIAGQVKGKTLLPLPVGSEQVNDAVEAEEK